MTLTNKANLPEPLVEAIRRDTYAKGKADFSVTQLIASARISQLRRQHSGQLTEDASDRIFSLIGQGIHSILERAASERYLIEERFDITHIDGTTVTGGIDLFDKETATLQDWKITSRYATQDGPKPEWTAQGNLNRFLMGKNGIEVKKIEYVAIYRDWSKMALARGVHGYPEKQVEVIPIPLWPDQQTEAYLVERIKAHKDAAESLPLCSDEERWYKPAKFALMRKGRKKAQKLYGSEQEASGAIQDPAKEFVESRPDENTRCLYYCPVSNYCSQFRELMGAA